MFHDTLVCRNFGIITLLIASIARSSCLDDAMMLSCHTIPTTHVKVIDISKIQIQMEIVVENEHSCGKETLRIL